MLAYQTGSLFYDSFFYPVTKAASLSSHSTLPEGVCLLWKSYRHSRMKLVQAKPDLGHRLQSDHCKLTQRRLTGETTQRIELMVGLQ